MQYLNHVDKYVLAAVHTLRIKLSTAISNLKITYTSLKLLVHH
jgi:hypothetical protein